MMGWNHGWGWGWPVFLVMAVVCVAMMIGMMRHGTSMMRHGAAEGRPPGDRDADAPERILARRLASGEIDVQEFERRRDALGRASTSPVDTVEPGGVGQRPPQA